MEAPPPAELTLAAQALSGTRRLLVLAGAGSSADAGVPTFRDDGGLWRQHRVEDLATPQGFARDPATVWEWYRERREQIAACAPHAGQRSLALLQRAWPKSRLLIATTNEDDLLERASVSAVVHLHGSIFETACSACPWREADRVDNGLSFVPCPKCGKPVRPGSVWFGEPLPRAALDSIEAFEADACLVIGSSGVVQPIAAIAPEMLLAGHPVAEINPKDTPLGLMAGCLRLKGKAKDLVPPLVDLLSSSVMREANRQRLADPVT